MNNDLLEFLKNSKDCFYIYRMDLNVYGINNTDEKYLVVVSDNFVFPNDFTAEDWIGFDVTNISDWFKMVMNGDIKAWECACINKKFIIKEHVKLMMTTNPLQLRNQIDEEVRNLSEESTLYDYWKILKDVEFANQIIENHKIVNFKRPKIDFLTLKYKEEDLKEIFGRLFTESYKVLKNSTDGILKQSKIKKILQKDGKI